MLAYVISWFIALSIHWNSLKRSSIDKNVNELIELIDSSINIDIRNKTLNEVENVKQHINFRIERKFDYINSLYGGKLLDIGYSKVVDLMDYGFLVVDSKVIKEGFADSCYDVVEYIENEYHKKVVSKKMFFSIKYELLGAFSVLVIILLFYHIVSLMF